MMKFVAPVLLLASAVAASYAPNDGGHGYGLNGVDAAVHSRHSVQTIPVSGSRSPGHSPVIDINSGALPLTLRFNSQSSRINAIQKHIGHRGQVQKQTAVDEPDLLIQNIKKPVIQEIREVISPFRQITQEVRPVQEQIETVIARGQDGAGGVGGNGGGLGGHAKYGGGHMESHY